jgi:hypothetical protein
MTKITTILRCQAKRWDGLGAAIAVAEQFIRMKNILTDDILCTLIHINAPYLAHFFQYKKRLQLKPSSELVATACKASALNYTLVNPFHFCTAENFGVAMLPNHPPMQTHLGCMFFFDNDIDMQVLRVHY